MPITRAAIVSLRATVKAEVSTASLRNAAANLSYILNETVLYCEGLNELRPICLRQNQHVVMPQRETLDSDSERQQIRSARLPYDAGKDLSCGLSRR